MICKLIARSLIPKKHWAYLSWHKDRFGIVSALLGYMRLVISKDKLARVPNPLSPISLFLRPGSVDQSVFDEVFFHRGYEINTGHPFVIVDAGAHIGLTSIYLANRFPDSSIVAIEPEESNFRLLERNTKYYSNIRAIKAGLWSRKTSLEIENPEAASWSFRVREVVDGPGIRALGIEDVMSMFNFDHIDLLKIDIEGAEKEVLLHCEGWIGKVDVLVIEFHDRIRSGCTESLREAVRNKNFSLESVGNSTLLRKRRGG